MQLVPLSGTVSVCGSGTSYIVTISNTTGAGTLGISVAGGSALDQAGNSDFGAGPSATFNVLSSDATLSNLALNAGLLTPSFSAGVTSYTRNLVNGVQAVTIVPTTNDPGATVLVNGTEALASGATSDPLPVSVGSNTITILVTAADGITTQTYTLTLIRAGARNDLLTSLELSRGSLSPAFTGANTSYTAAVANGVTSTTITAITANANTTMLLNGTTALASGVTSGAIPLKVGANTITLTTTAQNDTATRTYTIVITRGPSSNDHLTSLKMSRGTLNQPFTPDGLNYSANVGNGVAYITATPTTADPGATILLNGTATIRSGVPSLIMALDVGPNVIRLKVTAGDGITKQTYTVTVTRAAAKNDNLSSLKPSRGALSPVFTSSNTSYTVSVVNGVSSMTVTPTVADPDATILVNDSETLNSGTASSPIALGTGANIITIKVTAADGSTSKTYTLTVTRAAGSTDDYDPGISVTKPSEALTIADDGIQVHQGVSPNGDGINDFLTIDNIVQYPDNKLSIMNRNGQLIYQANGYDNSSKIFDGHSSKNGQMQLPGTYFYQLDYTAGGISKHKTGFLVLKY